MSLENKTIQRSTRNEEEKLYVTFLTKEIYINAIESVPWQNI